MAAQGEPVDPGSMSYLWQGPAVDVWKNSLRAGADAAWECLPSLET